MKTDRELLELAAKAHGSLRYIDGFGYIHDRGDGRNGAWWRPLEDDADALRLSYALGMDVDFGACRIVYGDEDYELEWDGSSGEISAARRAIVRTAAAIGEGME